jgi:hypothetical protein
MDDSPKMFYENKGQIIDNMNNVKNDVKYYTTALSPTEFSGQANVYLFDDAKMSFVQVHAGNDTIPDTLSRVDFQLVGEGLRESAVSAVNQSKDYRNYYLPHCTSGATYCYAYEQFNYREVYDNIDFEVRANQAFGKYYFIVHPGGNPSDIEFEFTGQDSANIDPYWIELYYHADILELPNAIAYEVNSNGTISPVNWSPAFLNLGNSKIGFQTDNYNTNKNLVIQLAPPMMMPPIFPPTNLNNLEWSTYYQSNSGLDWFNDIETGENNHVWLTGMTNSNTFPAQNGTTLNANGTDATLVNFNDIAELQWVTIIGGSGQDVGNALAVSSSSNAFIVGEASASFPNNISGFTGAYYDPTPSSTSIFSLNGFVAKFNGAGIKQFATYMGDKLSAINVSANDIVISEDNKIYVVGQGYIDNFAVANTSGGGFIMELDANFVPLWGTQYGNSTTSVNSITTFFNDTGNELYITGTTSSGITQTDQIAPNTAYQSPFGNGGGDYDAFITRFRIDRVIDWQTYYGGGLEDIGRKIHLSNSKSLITICGYTKSTNFPYHQGNATFIQNVLGGNSDAFFLQFNRSTGSRIWATYYGGPSTDEAYDITEVNNILYFTGFTGGGLNTKAWSGTNFYYNPDFNKNYTSPNLSFSPDAFLVGFDNSLDDKIATYFGGKDEDKGYALTVSNNGKLYLTGFSSGANVTIPNFPLEDFNQNSTTDYYKSTSSSFDGFIARFSPPFGTTTNTNQITEEKDKISIVPNPNGGIFNINLSNQNSSKSTILIYGANGVLIQTLENISINNYQIDLTKQAKGIYFIKVVSNDKVFVQSVVIN